ncbi:MAG: hypothetical protein BWX64_02371 [Acidobacteria bacterium ADurb.Bin051]|nr:MAG: hypothetical protein BWX64_02371 [Acidobacteria bacterium ADurb.Bin051]
MRTGRADGPQVVEVAVRPGVPRGLRQRARRPRVGPDVGVRIRVLLAVVERRGHVHDLPHGGVPEGARRELGDEAAHRRRLVEPPLGHQDLGEQPGERLGHRHRGVAARLVEAAGVPLVDDLSLMEDQDAVGVVRRERRLPAHRLRAAEGRELHPVDPRVERARERPRRAEPPAHLLRRHELPDMADRPAQLREAEVVGFRLHDEPVGRRRRTLHPAETHRIALRRTQPRRLLRPGRRAGAGDEEEPREEGERRPETLPAPGAGPAHHPAFFCSFAQLSRSVTVRLKTGRSGVWSARSAVK